MRKLPAIVGTMVLGVAALLAPAGPASADDGNGNRTCDRGEICFRNSSHTGFSIDGHWQHTFWYGNMSHGTQWLYGRDWTAPSIILQNNGNGFWNRDTACRVKIYDRTWEGVWYVYQDLARDYRGDPLYHENDGHQRC